MIFEEVVLHNFGVYQGRHEVPLAVPTNKPIVLMGALNGGGKTTFLDAMQLALYGKGAKCTGRERVGYHEYLESMINRNVSPTMGAGVELAFRTRSNGQDSTIRVVRNWQKRGQDIKELFEVQRDGVVDAVASERWQEFVEDFMPSQIADLFFFDGEKIEGLADPQRSAALLRVGVHSLLGIDLVEELCTSLQQVEKKRKTTGAVGADLAKLEELQQQLNEISQERVNAFQELASFNTELGTATKELGAAKAEFLRVGGELYNRRHNLVAEKIDLERQKARLEAQLKDIAGTILPLQISQSLLDRVISQTKLEQQKQNVGLLLAEATNRDTELLEQIAKLINDTGVIGQISAYFEQDRSKRYGFVHNSLPMPASTLDEFKKVELDQLMASASALMQEVEEVNENLLIAERHLGAIPDDLTIAQAQEAVDKHRIEVVLLEAKIAQSQEAIDALRSKEERLTKQVNSESGKLSEQLVQDEVSRRVVSHSVRARETLGKFKERLLHSNLDRLQVQIERFFQQLLRKRKLVHGVRINPETFQLSVISGTGQAVPSHRLSAGERQLLAVATLWALAHSSGRHLPAVIDTPLSRLDSRHRGTLVKHYFPKASHQVILLSTDEEVVGKYYQQLKCFIGREYLIDHDEDSGTSRIMTGYFANMPEMVAA